tara:strand:+ start:119 stop:931 length:813 start_codon:yes stop_codon:yes gene_type:complete
MPTSGDVNSSAPFSFSSASQVSGDYASKPSVNALARPTLHNSVPESMVNSTASVPLFVKPYEKGFEKGYSEGDILFVRRDQKNRDSRHNEVANLPVLNHMLRTKMQDKENEEGQERKYKDVGTVLKHYNYFGILNTDMDTGSKWQRLLNINVRGRSRVARLWKPPTGKGFLTKGTCLFLGFFMVDETEAKASRDPNGQRIFCPGNAKGKYVEVKAVLACSKDFSKAVHLIPIGIVSQVTLKSPSDHSIKEGHIVTESCKSLERIEVLMRI